MGAPLEVFAEEAQARLQRATQGSMILRRIVWRVAEVLPWVAPSGGVPADPYQIAS
jgi:hypothetical protein